MFHKDTLSLHTSQHIGVMSWTNFTHLNPDLESKLTLG